MKRFARLVGVATILALAAAGGVWWWRNAAERAALARTLVAAEHAVNGGRWAEARAVLADQARRRGRPDDTEARRRWTRVEFKAAGGLRDFATLEALAEGDLSLIGEDEMAALWLWRARSAEPDEAGAEKVRAVWRGREATPVFWWCAEFDALLVGGRREEARALLEGIPAGLAGTVPLLLRRALVEVDAAARFKAIEDAYRADPRDADLRGLRGGLLERIGQPAYARVEYVAALVADPGNPLRRDELASFYLRSGDLGNAVATWREGLDERSPDFQWVRAIFWGKILGLPAPDEAAKLSEARRRRFAGWLASLPEGRHWDEAGYVALHLAGAHADREPAVTWLRVLEALREGNLEQAGTLLTAAPGVAVNEAPILHAALRATLAVRAGVDPAHTGIVWPVTAAGSHRWWTVAGAALGGDAAAGAEFAEVARGPLAGASAFLAAGWTGPALALADEAEAAKPTAPDWMRFGLLQARRAARGLADALAWGEKLPPYPPTDYIVASFRLAAGRAAEAEPALRRLAAGSDDTGLAAAWLLGTWFLEQGRAADAAGLVAASPALKDTAEGADLRARVALARGGAAEAVEIYTPWAETSPAAGAYLARTAYAAGDLPKARWLTELWMARMPDNLQLRANLAALAEAERKAGGRP